MNITIEIPALEGIVPAIEKLAASIAGGSTPATPEKPAAKKAAKKAAVKPKAEPTPEPEVPAEPEIEQADLVKLAKDLCAVTGGTQKVLRATLDSAGIKGEKLSTCDSSFYPAIKKALEAAIKIAPEDAM
jgi:hypothetical protein